MASYLFLYDLKKRNSKALYYIKCLFNLYFNLYNYKA